MFEHSLQLDWKKGYLKRRRGIRVALDTTYILGLGAVKDTYNLLADGIVKLMRALAAVEDVPFQRCAEASGYCRCMCSSVKGETAIDWSDSRARRKLLGEIVADADRLLELAWCVLAGLPANGAEQLVIVYAAELLGRSLLQDVKGGAACAGDDADSRLSLKDGVGKDRIVSVHDLEMRHGHKSKRPRFDNHKAAVVVDTDTQLITAVDVLSGNVWDSVGALELVEQSEASAGVPVVEAMGCTAYGDRGARPGIRRRVAPPNWIESRTFPIRFSLAV